MKNKEFIEKITYPGNLPEEEVIIGLAIVDDDPEILEIEESLARKFFDHSKYKWQIKSYLHPKQLLQELEEHTQTFDLFMVDIEMEELSGQELIVRIQKENPSSIIIIVSNYAKYAVDGYRYGVFRYICKQELNEKLDEALKIACQIICQEQSQSLLFISSGEKVILKILDIMYVHYERKYTFFYTKNTFCKIRCTLSDAMNLLTEEPFVQIDKAYAVNVRYISRMDEDTIWMNNGSKLPVSRRRRKDVADKLMSVGMIRSFPKEKKEDPI